MKYFNKKTNPFSERFGPEHHPYAPLFLKVLKED
jgi:hypothetical protein